MDDFFDLKQQLVKDLNRYGPPHSGGSQVSEHEAGDEPLDLKGTLHELQVYREELQTQNEQLRIAWHDLETSQKKYMYLFDFAPTSYFTIDRNSVIREVNLTGAEMLGYARRYLVGKPLHLYVAPESRGVLAMHFRGVFRGIEAPIEVLFSTQSGRIFPVLLQSSLIRDDFEQNPYCLMAAMDITERKQTEDQLRKLSQIVEQSPSSVLIIDTEGTVEYINPAFTQATGYTWTDIVGADLAILKSGEHSPEYYKRLWEIIRGGGEWRGDICIRKKTGELYWELQSITPIRNSNGMITHYAIVRIDDTERKRAEEALRNSNHRLEETLTELKATQQQVLQQERLAAVGQLAAGIAHDFNNILTSIQGFAELVQLRSELSGSAKSDLGHIIDQTDRAAHLIRQILDFSRISMRQPRQVSPGPFLKEMIRFLQRTIPENIDIRLEIETQNCLINADPTQLHQLLTNLAVNARDAMPARGELIFRLSSLSLESGQSPPCPELPPGEWVVLSVIDTGSGIPAEIRPRIFEPFFTTKDVGQGTGLGLAQVYGIVKQHDGYIELESEEGKGSTFTVYLPAVQPQELSPVEEVVAEIPRGHGETVLVAEDEPMVLEISKALLEHLGYHVLTATNGQEAVDIFNQHQDQIALILADMVMPQMDGVDVLEALQAQDPEVKVVLVTGYPLGKEAPKVLGKGFINWLQKPIRLTRLARVVDQVLKDSKKNDHTSPNLAKAASLPSQNQTEVKE
jgi:PAS domain S-box-containing protein